MLRPLPVRLAPFLSLPSALKLYDSRILVLCSLDTSFAKETSVERLQKDVHITLLILMGYCHHS